MAAIHVIGVDRPQLAALLAARGLCVASDPVEAVARFACSPGRVPTLVEAADSASAAAMLDAGADDVVLARDPDALVAARLAALVRRPGTPIRIGGLTIDTIPRQATRDGRPLALRPREYALLLHLARHAGEVVTHAVLRRVVLGLRIDPGTNGLAVHVSRLRSQLDREGTPMLATEKGKGYRLVVPEE